MEWLLLLGLAIVGYVEHGRLRRRVTWLEATVADLQRELAARAGAARPRHAAATAPVPEVQQRAASAPAITDAAWRREIRPSKPVPAATEEVAAPYRPLFPADAATTELPIVSWVRDYFTGGNLIVRVGVLVLFFGVAFLLKYAAEHSHLPVEARLIGVAVAALVLLGLGWRLRDRRPGYALALQGGGVGVLYLTVFAALRLYALLPAAGAFGLLVAIGVLSAVLAVRQNSMAFAMLGVAGGFLAPVLTATEHGNHIVLFSYYTLLNLGVVGIAWFRAWRPLNLLAFAFTFGISAIWGASHYQPDLLGTTEPFLIVFWLLFVAISVLFAFRRAPDLLHYVDGTLVFGTPVVVMGVQSGLVRHIEYALAYSALAFGAFYVLLAWLLLRRRQQQLRLLVEAFLALGVAFATLAIPLALQGRWTAACWALEGVAILWVGLRQQRRLAVAAGVALQLVAGIAYLVDAAALSAHVAVANSHFVAALIVASGGFLAATLMRRGPAWLQQWHRPMSTVLFYWALAWSLYAGISEIERFVSVDYRPAAMLAYVAYTAATASLVAQLLDWATARVPPLLLLPVMVAALYGWLPDGHPAAFGGWWAWPMASAVAYLALYRHESAVAPGARTALHVVGLWTVVGLLIWEGGWQVGHVTAGAWMAAVRGVIPAAALLALPVLARRGGWPIAAQARSYLILGAAGLALYLCGWVLATNVSSDGDAVPLPYIPVLSPLDLAGGLALLASIAWLLRLPSFGFESRLLQQRRVLYMIVAATTFCWLNTMLLRSVHHWAGVPYAWNEMMASTLTQASLSLFWTMLALAAMLWSARRGHRLPWFCGAILMGVVIAKLLLVDLSHIGTVPRIVSFLGVGTLMLVVGYFSPLPPSTRETRA